MSCANAFCIIMIIITQLLLLGKFLIGFLIFDFFFSYDYSGYGQSSGKVSKRSI